MRKWLEAGLVVALVAAPVSALAARVSVTEPWVRALPGNAAGYFTLRNNASVAITLTGAHSRACGMIMLHKSNTGDGMASMSDVESVKLAAGETVKFEPGSYHLMCMDPRPDVAPGKRVMISLDFGDGSSTPVSFAVRNAAGH